MGYTVYLYEHTNLNSVNTIENPAKLRSLLSSSNIISGGVIDTLQDVGLQNIRVQVSYEEAVRCDFVETINSSTKESRFFSIPAFGVKALSNSVTEITISFDPWLSCGGITVDSDGNYSTHFEIIDGWTDRCTVSQDTFGLYSDDDTLIAPAEPLELISKWFDPIADSTSASDKEELILTETSADLAKMAVEPMEAVTYKANIWSKITGEVATGIEGDVNYTPQVYQNTLSPTSFSLQASAGTGVEMPKGDVATTDGLRVYINSSEQESNGNSSSSIKAMTVTHTINKGLANLHKLGVENAVVNRWTIPRFFLATAPDYESANSFYSTDTLANSNNDLAHVQDKVPVYATDQHVTNIIAGVKTLSLTGSDFKLNYWNSVKNKRLLYGKWNSYGIVTCSGESMSAMPEELTTYNENATIQIIVTCDPRPTGRPYYRFKVLNNDIDFYRNCISGAPWANSTYVYDGASGSALNTIKYSNSISMSNAEYEQQQIGNVIGLAGDVASAALSVAAPGVGTIAGAGIQAGTAALRGAIRINTAQNRLNNAEANYRYPGMYAKAGFGKYSQAQNARAQVRNAQTAYENAQMQAEIFNINEQNRINSANQRAQAQTEQIQAMQNRSLATGAMNIAGDVAGMYSNAVIHEEEIRQEMQGLFIANNVYVPTIQFPYNSSFLRDVKHNGILVYRYELSGNDIRRIDKLLTMYGYKYTEALTVANFTRRTHFDFVMCSGVTVTGLPKWWNELLAEQLKGGIRIWHDELPTANAYSDNPIRS